MAIKNIVKLSELEFLNRIDSELYNPFLKVSHNLLFECGYPIKRLRDTCTIKSGTTPTDRDDSLREGPILFKTTDIRNSVLDPFSNYYHINENIYERMSPTKLFVNDVLLNIVGATLDVIGRSAYTSNFFDKANITQAMVLLRIKNSIKPGYLFSYLNTKYAQDQIKRYARPTGQYNLNLTEVGQIEIPIINIVDQDNIQAAVEQSGFLLKKSSELFIQANELLEKEFCLDKINHEKKKSYVTNVSEVASTRRMNAEYFSPLVKTILSQPFFVDSKPIGSLFQIIRGNSPKQYFENGFPVIKTKNIRIPEIDRDRVSDFVLSTKDLTTIQENDLLLASMGVGSLGRMSYILSLDEDTVVDGTIRVFRRKSSTPINYEIPTLLFLSTKVGQELIYRGIVGSTGIISLPDEYLSKIPIPHFPEDLCLELTRLVKGSMMAKRESKRLLEEAKNRVEQLIEEAANK